MKNVLHEMRRDTLSTSGPCFWQGYVAVVYQCFADRHRRVLGEVFHHVLFGTYALPIHQHCMYACRHFLKVSTPTAAPSVRANGSLAVHAVRQLMLTKPRTEIWTRTLSPTSEQWPYYHDHSYTVQNTMQPCRRPMLAASLIVCPHWPLLKLH